MDCYLLIILIILLALSLIGIYMLIDCLGDSSFSNIARRASATIGAADGGQVYSQFTTSEDMESNAADVGAAAVTSTDSPTTANKRHSSCCSVVSHGHCHDHLPTTHRPSDLSSSSSLGVGAGTVALLVSTLHRGSLSYHSQGLCNQGGGNWSNGSGVWASGRPSGPNTWSPVSGGAFDSCQCEDSGGLF